MSAASGVVKEYERVHKIVLRFLNGLTDEQIHWRASPQSHPIAWHAWHLARWADHLQASAPGMTPELAQWLEAGVQVWTADGVSASWGFAGLPLGFAETGMDMPDDVAIAMMFPAKDVLMRYVEATFMAAIHALSAVDDTQYDSAEQPQPITEGIFGGGTVGDAILSHMIHAWRHLGAMECLLGLQGQSGTATR